MIDIEQLHREIYDDQAASDDATKVETAVSYLETIARRYNQLYHEHELLKEATGFNKPFPLLRLPREIRDEIYTYCLVAPKTIDNTVPRRMFLTRPDNPWRPSTSTLIRTNEQIYNEAIDILYAKNNFRFNSPGELYDFEQKIGLENRKRVRKLTVWVRFPGHDEVVPDPKHLRRSEYDSVPSHWIAALKTSRLRCITHLDVEGEFLFSFGMSLLSMPDDLAECIEEFFARSSVKVPHLTLKGFHETEREQFPDTWEVMIDQWEDYKNELAALEREMEETDPYTESHGYLGYEGADDG